ncbi:MAG: maleylpyruvate isomerase family mycothiol-dependent enzyme [Acidimicrobiales bacterium]|nr:maleylpyruvate isomerase family mycothiol-dependent enzyme [Acidimicrobiales bacterium]
MDVWNEVAGGRHRLADRIDGLGPDALDGPSWCGGWRGRDVLGHLVYLAEASQAGVWLDVVRLGPRPDRALDRRARELGELPVPELTERLRGAAEGRFHILGTPAVVVVGELLVHGNDLLAPLGESVDIEPEVAAAVAPTYHRVGKFAFGGNPTKGVSLVADDADLRLGDGPEVRGRAFDLVLLLANRRQALDRLEGPGVEVVSARG